MTLTHFVLSTECDFKNGNEYHVSRPRTANVCPLLKASGPERHPVILIVILKVLFKTLGPQNHTMRRNLV